MFRITNVLSVGPFASVERAELLRRAGVTHILNVSGGPSELTRSEQGFREVVWEPLDDFSRMPLDRMTHILDVLHRMTSEPESHVYVHCVAGRLRSPTVLWLYLISLGTTPDNARELIEKRARDTVPGHRLMVDQQHVALALRHGSEKFLPHPRPEVSVPFIA